jgi:hypothetical protein
MPNERYYSPSVINTIMSYALNQIDFSTSELTRDTGCSLDLTLTKEFIHDIAIKIYNPQHQTLLSSYNSHDWAKIVKHIFQNGQIIDFTNEGAMITWHQFAKTSRAYCGNPENPSKYSWLFKEFIAELIRYKSIEQAECIHKLLFFAHKVYSAPKTTMSNKAIGAMLSAVMYDGLQLDGITRSITRDNLPEIQQKIYIEHIKNIAVLLGDMIKETFYSVEFNGANYEKIKSETLSKEFKLLSFSYSMTKERKEEKTEEKPEEKSTIDQIKRKSQIISSYSKK